MTIYRFTSDRSFAVNGVAARQRVGQAGDIFYRLEVPATSMPLITAHQARVKVWSFIDGLDGSGEFERPLYAALEAL